MLDIAPNLLEPQEVPPTAPTWSYGEAFKRNRGLISADEQDVIRNTRIAIAGMGGVGGSHLMTLARLGFAKFSIADPDTFAVANCNRQHGATIDSLGLNKAEVMAELVTSVNPDVDVQVFSTRIGPKNVDRFLAACAIYVDGLDFFAIDARRLVFRRAQELGKWAITAAPLGFSAASLVFHPRGMSFDQYFDLHDGQSQVDQLVAFAVGLAPKATHRAYMDLSAVNIEERTGPAVASACQLASSIVSAEAVKITLGRGKIRAVPYYAQHDIFSGCLKSGRLAIGNRNLRQRIKRSLLKGYLRRKGLIPNE